MVDELAAASAAEVSAVSAAQIRGRTRARLAARPHARDVVEAVALEHGACIRPVQLRKVSLDTSKVEQVMIPCGTTMASICPPCAERAKVLRAAQCWEGWHLADEPTEDLRLPGDYQRWLVGRWADLEVQRELAAANGEETSELGDFIEAVQQELAATGVRGHLDASTDSAGEFCQGDRSLGSRRHRSTRRRQDAPDLPTRKVSRSTVGRVYRAPDGKLYRPSMFVTLTCPSYGPVRDDSTPVDPATYDYEGAARDALHFAELFDRFIQNLRRFAGYDVQYFAAIEPQRRLAPHVHIAIRGTISRTDLRRVLAATYHQVWWPATRQARLAGDRRAVWHEASRRYLDPATGQFLPTWDQALDAIGQGDQPRHVVRFGPKFDAQGVLAGSKDASRCIGYLTKYLVKQIDECHQPESEAQQKHVAQLVAALEYEPCSPACANWLRYGITPKNPRPGLTPGACKGKAHRPEYLGYAGRRVLVSRRWSGKTLAEHRGDRRAWLVATLGISATADAGRYTWQRVSPADPDYLPLTRRLILVVQDRMRWKRALEEARRRAQIHDSKSSAPRRAA